MGRFPGMWVAVVLFFSACAPGPRALGAASQPEATRTPARAAYPDLGESPELADAAWLNVDAPLRLADLRGKVVLLNMWTFGCINCRNVLPSVRAWFDAYADAGLVVIGNHYPEFDYEADLDNLQEALGKLDVRYPVAVDNAGKTWQAYENRYWPTIYLIDKQGHIRYVHIGEGRYEETETAIQALLAEPAP